LSITIEIKQGDTFESLSRQNYGSENYASNIQKANPGVSEPLPIGNKLLIPDVPTAPQNKVKPLGSNIENECVMRIQGARFRYWNDLKITRSIDQMDVIQFSVPWDSDSKLLRDFFAPFSYKETTIEVGSQILFTGTIVSVVTVLSDKKILNVSAYSKPGVLNDCTPSSSSFPLEFNGLGLKEIAKSICEPFGLSVEFEGDAGAVFDQVSCESGKKALSFLIDLAKRRNFVISSTSDGKLLFWKAIETGEAVANLKQGESPLLSVTPSFSEQDFYSSITGIDSVSIGALGSQFTVQNTRVQGYLRPLTFTVNDVDDVTVQTAVENKAGRMYGNAVQYSVSVATWRDSSGNLWEPNTMISVEAKDAMIYNQYKFVIRSINFKKDSKKQTATLDLVLVGCFSGKIPESLPWEE